VWGNLLYLRPGTREHFLAHLARDWPAELERYERLYQSSAYLQRSVTGPVLGCVAELKKRFGIADRREKPLTPPSEPVQMAIAI
jgi:hypothetical protein